jgi:uncharacterized protein (DUF1697 family)
MKTYISLLRGINVGGKRIIKMDFLKLMYEDLGFEKVKTFIQSGNVLFKSGIELKTQIENLIYDKIIKETGFDVDLQIIELEDYKRIIENNPFEKENRDIAFMHISFFKTKAQASDIEIITKNANYGEEFAFSPEAIYLYLPQGYGRSKLTNSFFEKLFKVSVTTRNWKTSKELLRLAEEI